MQTQFEMQTQSEKKREMRKQSDMRRKIYIQEQIKGFERYLNKEDLKNDHEFVAHCHRIIALIKRKKSLNLIRGLCIDIVNNKLGEDYSHEKCGIYNYPAYQDYKNL